MRVFILLAAMLGACSAAVAQDAYLPMLEENRTWCGVEGGWLPTPVTYSIESDTVIGDGTLWHRLAIQYEGNPSSGLAGWFHEDSDAGQVWMRWDLDLDPGTLWFDFGMEPGDTMVAPNCDWADITCTAVEPFTWTDGTVSRRLTLQLLPDNENFVEYWIEGIGSENGPMGPAAYLCIADWDPHAACFTQAGALRHDFQMDTTWLPAHSGCPDSLATNGVEAVRAPVGRLVVNGGQLSWVGPRPPASVTLQDLMGRSLGPLNCALPCTAPRTGGIIIATLSDGRRQKIRIN